MVIEARSTSSDGGRVSRRELEGRERVYPRFAALRFGPDERRRWLPPAMTGPSRPKIDLRTTSWPPAPEPALLVEEGGGLGELMRRSGDRRDEAGEGERELSEGEEDTDRPLFVPTLILRPVPAM